MKKVLFLLLALASCSGGQGESELASDFVQTKDVQKTVAAQEQALSKKYLVSKGVILSESAVNVFSRIEGQLLEVKLLEGQKVRKGQVLFNLDDLDLRNKVYLSESQVEHAHFLYEEILIGQGYKRDSLGSVPETVSAYARVKSGLNVIQRELEINREKLSYAKILSPQDGVVTGVNVPSYSFVKPGETLCSIVDPDNLIVEFSILETELSRFTLGCEVEVRSIAYSDEPHRAVVISLDSVVDQSGMVKVLARIDDSRNLLPGMTADVSI